MDDVLVNGDVDVDRRVNVREWLQRQSKEQTDYIVHLRLWCIWRMFTFEIGYLFIRIRQISIRVQHTFHTRNLRH